MARGFVNLNRYRHGRAVKRNSRQRTVLQSKREIRGKQVKLRR